MNARVRILYPFFFQSHFHDRPADYYSGQKEIENAAGTNRKGELFACTSQRDGEKRSLFDHEKLFSAALSHLRVHPPFCWTIYLMRPLSHLAYEGVMVCFVPPQIAAAEEAATTNTILLRVLLPV